MDGRGEKHPELTIHDHLLVVCQLCTDCLCKLILCDPVAAAFFLSAPRFGPFEHLYHHGSSWDEVAFDLAFPGDTGACVA